MKLKITTKIRRYTIPNVVLTLDPIDVRELCKILIKEPEISNIKSNLLPQLTDFLSEYDSGKWNKHTKIEEDDRY